MVSAVTCAVKENRWQEQFLIGSRQLPPFFRRCGHLRTPTQVSEDFKTPIKILSNIILQLAEFFVVAKWKSNPASNYLCGWKIEESNGKTDCETLLNNGSSPPRQHVTRV